MSLEHLHPEAVPLQVKGEAMLKKQFEGKPLGNLL